MEHEIKIRSEGAEPEDKAFDLTVDLCSNLIYVYELWVVTSK